MNGVPKWGGEVACGPFHCGPRWRFEWGHEACEGCSEMERVDPCGPCHWGSRCSSPWSHEVLVVCAELGRAGANGFCYCGAFG
eukprot:9314143-Pyramimonas_sp.AAC.1